MAFTEMQRKAYYANKYGMTSREKKIVNFYELQWHLRHRVPTIEEVANHVQIKQVALNYHLQRACVKKALKERGIPYEQHTQEDLTATQVAAAITVMNFADDRTIPVKLDQLGISPSQYFAWLNDPQFKNLVDNLSEQNLRNIKPTAISEFTRLVNAGDWNAIKYYLDATGAVQDSGTPATETLMRFLIEIIQKHVKDPDTIAAIAEDIKRAANNRTLEVRQENVIEGKVSGVDALADLEATKQEQFEKARRMLGV